jgi:hypothetical protein
MINDAQNKMMTSAPDEKAAFHFPGDGIWHNVVIWAVNIEEATKEYLATRKLIKTSSSTLEQTVVTPTEERNAD